MGECKGEVGAEVGPTSTPRSHNWQRTYFFLSPLSLSEKAIFQMENMWLDDPGVD